MTHLSPEELASHIAGAPAPDASAHLHQCIPCSDALRKIELVAQVLMSESALPDLGAPPPPSPWTGTAGSVRIMLRLSAASLESDPKHSLQLCRRAWDTLSAAPSVASTERRLLRAAALRERANALRYLGRYAEGLAALDDAEGEISHVLVGAFERARIDYTRATLLWKMREQLDHARGLARSAAATFREHGDDLRALHAELLLAGIDFQNAQYAEAREAFARALIAATLLDDVPTIARVRMNLAACETELGDLLRAATHYSEASALFRHAGMTVEELRTDWNLALLSIRSGRDADGSRLLARTAEGFRATGNACDAALVTLDLVEHLAGAGDLAAARTALTAVATAGVPTRIAEQIRTLQQLVGTAEAEKAIRETRAALRFVVSAM